jgi:hypothetical protein
MLQKLLSCNGAPKGERINFKRVPNLPFCFSTPPVDRRSKNSMDVTEHASRSALTAPAAPDADQETLPLLQRK